MTLPSAETIRRHGIACSLFVCCVSARLFVLMFVFYRFINICVLFLLVFVVVCCFRLSVFVFRCVSLLFVVVCVCVCFVCVCSLI